MYLFGVHLQNLQNMCLSGSQKEIDGIFNWVRREEWNTEFIGKGLCRLYENHKNKAVSWGY